ncbi:RF-1 domain-containing protein [Microdochium trichocladiopsis]|uniref:RF-1 domain-containing protein n=1 Tax=Microdochium trichocladiopsis TaxID=1682393 RepID=A0A9P9BPH1_9PEZI|nr:RF-1 domain-containing protein [Microdochium trichocladiopsis]KAH7033129.1 RF-1 domain-containing protein [Microdochium trichocladiopsis]
MQLHRALPVRLQPSIPSRNTSHATILSTATTRLCPSSQPSRPASISTTTTITTSQTPPRRATQTRHSSSSTLPRPADLLHHSTAHDRIHACPSLSSCSSSRSRSYPPTTTPTTATRSSRSRIGPGPFAPTPSLQKQMPQRPKPPPDEEFEEYFLKGSGPGGQKINKTNSAVQLLHKPTGIVGKSQATRSRSQNRTIARQLLADKLDALHNGQESRAAIVGSVKAKKKASSAKKSRRKYRKLAEEGQAPQQEGVGPGQGAATAIAGDGTTDNAANDSSTIQRTS